MDVDRLHILNECIQNFNQSHTELANHNEDEYILISDERLKTPPAHTFYIRVRPNKPFLVLNKTEEQYEITSIRATPCVGNGIMNPQKNLQIQAANISGRTIMVHVGQPIAIMTRLNHVQVNMINQRKLSK